MRSILLLVGTLLFTFSIFLTYRLLQPVSPRLQGGLGTAVQPVAVSGSAPRFRDLGRGDRPWIRNIDRLGRLASRFKADDYQPRGNGLVHVIQPRAEFFQYSGGRQQKVAIEGETGDIEVQEPADSGSAKFEKGSSGTPKRGRIKRGVNPVTIRLYPDVAAPSPQKDHVSITLTTDNLYFDNEKFEIKTDAIVDQNGNEIVPADQVPIHVTGDYEFDGTGLVLHWNDLEGRLEDLTIAHGDHLTILHPSSTSFGGADSKKSAAGGPGTQPAEPLADGSAAANASMTLAPSASSGQALTASGLLPPAGSEQASAISEHGASTVPPAVGVPPAGRKPESGKQGKHGPQPPYVAHFEHNVRITQGIRGGDEKQMATADWMTVDFLLNQSKPSTQPSAGSTGVSQASAPQASAPQASAPQASAPKGDPTGYTNSPQAASTSSPQADSGPSPTTGPVTVASTQPSTQPATQPSDGAEPVNVYWVGTLVVQPNTDLPPGALQPGQSIVHLMGDAAPVHVTRDNNDVVCARLDYFSPEGNVALSPSAAFPQVVIRQLAANGAATGPQADPGSKPPDDAVITADNIDYSGVDHVAVMHGFGDARVQLKADPSDPAGPSKPGLLDIRWQRLARIYFLNRPTADTSSSGKSPRQQLQIDHAHLEGDVDLRHPQLALKSQLLDATFASVLSPVPGGRAVLLPSAEPPNDANMAATTSPSPLPAVAPREQTILRHLVATDTVTCQMTDEAGKKQNVECHQLTMDTALSPLGKLYPKKIDFFGDARADAHAFDPTQDIHAGQIGLTFIPTASTVAPPTTKPAVVVARATTGPSTALGTGPSTQPTTRPVELETMTAMDRVRVKTTEGAFASSERLYVQMIEGQPHARLTGRPGAAAGSPESLATVIDAKKNVVIGPSIVSDPKLNIATVEGPGSMHLIRQDKPTDKPRPIDVVFLTRAVMDSPDNVIDILDTVSVISPDPDGTINTANGKHVHITLADKPPPEVLPGTTRPSAHASAASRPGASPTSGPSTHPTGGTLADSSQVDLMKGKVVTGLVLEKDAVVNSTLTDPVGAILRQSELKGELIRYVLSSTQPGAKGTFIVPVPGQMLVRDHRPPAPPPAPAKPGKAPAAPAESGDPGGSRGATAFKWSKQLTYDEATNTAVFTGDVFIVHQDDDAKEEPARLRADKVVAVFEPRPNPAAKPVPTQPGAAPQPGSQLQLKSMTATGNVTVTRAASELDAPRMDYDPVTGWMVATGTPRQPATFVDATGVNSATAGRIDWNAQTWNVKLKDIISRTGRR